MWKCPKCSHTTKGKNAYNRMQKHYKQAHGKQKKTKGEDTKKHTYRPPKGFGGKK